MREAAGTRLQAGTHTGMVTDKNRDKKNAAGGRLVLAATPIGNTGDASARLTELLRMADIVAAEDTRRLYDLANRLGVRVGGKVVAYHDHNEHLKVDGLLDGVERGAVVLVVSDAGMPTINDPGLAIVRRAIERGLPVTCAPGPSAVLDALALSGLPTDRFCFEGFVPRKESDRVRRLRSLLTETRTIVFYETPQRIARTMDAFAEVFPSSRPMVLARELTKDYEEVRRSTVADLRQSVIDDPPRGEIVLVLQGASEEELRAAVASGADGGEAFDVDRLAREADNLSRRGGLKPKDAIAATVQAHPYADGSLANRKDVYAAMLRLRQKAVD